MVRRLRGTLLRVGMGRRLQAAMAHEDAREVPRLVGDSIGKILRTGLTSKQLSILKKVYSTGGNEMKERLRSAFSVGWTKSPGGSLSHAADQVLREAYEIIAEHTSPARGARE